MILANCIGAVHTEILGMTDRGAVVAWIGAIAYTLQILMILPDIPIWQ